jgi:hypothetical protein
MPVRQTRSGTRGLPPLALRACLEKIGSTNAHNSSGTNNLPIASSVTTTEGILDFGIEYGNVYF